MKYVIIVNGKPESGKTSFEKLCENYIESNEYGWVHNVSSIDPIKKIYEQLGWNGCNKGDKERKHLSTLKKIWVESCDGPVKYLVNYVTKLDDNGDSYIFTDVREESEIIKLQEIFDALSIIDIKCITILIKRKYVSGIKHGNSSDDNIGQNMSLYDAIIYNNDSLETLCDYANKFIEEINNYGRKN